MEDTFLKSALPVDHVLELDDTTLALPADPTPRSSTRLDSDERSLRVHQQVQLTLRRKTKKSLANGGVHLQKNTPRSFDSTDGFMSNSKINGLGYSNCFSESSVQRPSGRMEVSPPSSPKLFQSHFNCSAHSCGMHTLPGPIHSHTGGSTLNFSSGSDPFRRYAFSEATYGTRRYASAPTPGSFRWRSVRQTAGPRYASAAAGVQQDLECGSPWSYKQDIFREDKMTHTGQRSMRFGSAQPDGGLSWLGEVRKGGQKSLRHKLYTASFDSTAMDMENQLEAEIPIQQMHSQNVTPLRSGSKPLEMTLERAVNLLTQDNEEMLICAVTYIQNQCFQRADAKKMVYYLHGVKKLLQLLNSDSEEVQRIAAGALRNVVYQSNENKVEVKENDGLALVLNALTNSHDLETRRQLTGILWNLSSHDVLKQHFPREATRVLTKSVLVPSSGISEGENPKDELFADDDAFYNTTGCLRNLSSAGPDIREEMRDCENLIDSLIYYIRGTVANRKTDDKSTENCVCILHNLSYRIELPEHNGQTLRESQQNLAHKQTSLSCFSSRSAKIAKDLKQQHPLLEEKANPYGKEWLWSPIAFRMYLSLVACSTREVTKEAAVGALLNITGGNGAMTDAIAFTIVQRENGLQHIKKVLEEGDGQVKRMAIFLVKNLSRQEELHPAIVNQVLPEVVKMLPDDDGDDGDNDNSDHAGLPSEVTTSLCEILINLSQSDVKNAKAIIHHGAIPKIINISYIYNSSVQSQAGQAACLLLRIIWKYTDLHGDLKRRGFKKSHFINARTAKLKI